MSPTDQLVNVSYSQIKAMLEDEDILRAVQELKCKYDDCTVVRGFRRLQQLQEEGADLLDPDLKADNICTKEDVELICSVIRRALELRQEGQGN